MLRNLKFSAHSQFMWGFTIYLMHLPDYLRGRTYKIQIQCRMCGRAFMNDRELDIHIRTDHRVYVIV